MRRRWIVTLSGSSNRSRLKCDETLHLQSTRRVSISCRRCRMRKGPLVPVISARTVRFHYEKHHKGYVEKLNTLVAEEGLQHVPLVELIRRTHGDAESRRDIQQCGAGMESQLLLAMPQAYQSRDGQQPDRRARSHDQRHLRQLRCAQDGAGRPSDDAVRERLGLARAQRQTD